MQELYQEQYIYAELIKIKYIIQHQLRAAITAALSSFKSAVQVYCSKVHNIFLMKNLILNMLKNDAVNTNEKCLITKTDDGIVLAFNEDALIDMISNDKNEYAVTIDVTTDKNPLFENEINGFNKKAVNTISKKSFVKLCSKNNIIPSVKTIRKLAENNSALIRVAQWGGVGGMPRGIGDSIGGHYSGEAGGFSRPSINFDETSTRVQFDQTLESARELHRDDKNKFLSTEQKLQGGETLLGHQRNEVDDNLIPYTLSFRERRKRKKEQQIQRMVENRKVKDKVNKDSVSYIKSIKPNEDDYKVIEEKLKTKREVEDPDPNYKRPQHGPESYLIRRSPSVKTSSSYFKIKRDGNQHAFRPEFSRDFLEDYFSSHAPHSGDSISPNRGYHDDFDSNHPDEVAFGGTRRIEKLPWSIEGYYPENRTEGIGTEGDKLWGGHPYEGIQLGPRVMDNQIYRDSGDYTGLENDPPDPESFNLSRYLDTIHKPVPLWDSNNNEEQTVSEKSPLDLNEGIEEKLKDKRKNKNVRTQYKDHTIGEPSPWPYADSSLFDGGIGGFKGLARGWYPST